MSRQDPQRLHYLDALRSTLMLLGLVLHSARPYSSGDWRVNDPAQWAPLDVVGSVLHLFRMPAFFVVAGFFAMYLIGRRTTPQFIRERSRRTLVPFVVTLLTLNVLQAWFVARQVEGDTSPLWSSVVLPQLWDGSLVSHLWFLVCLAAYFALTAVAAPLLRRLGNARMPWSANRWGPSIAIFVLVAGAAFYRVGIAVVDKLTAPLLHENVLGLIMPFTVLEYLPFFAVGLVLCAFPQVMDRFARVNFVVLGLALLGAAGVHFLAAEATTLQKALRLVSEVVLVWMIIRALFALFQRIANRPSPAVRYLSDASYSVYLFHHLVVIVAATLLIPVGLPPALKFFMVLATAAIVSLAAYHLLIRRSPLLSYLFNGAIRPGSGPRTGDSAVQGPAADGTSRVQAAGAKP